MTRTLEVRAPSAHCYHCGSMDVVAVCHHCGRPMCAEDGVATAPGRRNTEFSELGLDNVKARHCHEHDHEVDVGLRWLIVSGGVVSVAGAIWLTKSLWIGISLVVVGVVAAGFGFWLRRRRRDSAVHDRPPFPLVPTIESASITETVHAEIRLDPDGTYRAPAQPVTGRLKVDMMLRKADRDRLARYREKYQLAEDEPVPYSAGYLVLRGAVGLEFDNSRIPVPVIALRGMVADYPFLGPDGGRNRRYQVDLNHHLRRGSEVREIPLWLTPSLVAESDQRTLELDVQWDAFGHEDEPLEIDHITALRLVVPVGWGNIREIDLGENVQTSQRSFRREPDTEDPEEFVHLIKMTGIRLPRTAVAARRLRLLVHFEEQVETADTIRGSVDMLFRRALSGVSTVEVHHPLGGRRTWAKNEKDRAGQVIDSHTRVVADFSLSLAGVRYQDTRVVPDPRRSEDDDKHVTDVLPNVIPDYETVLNLTNALSTSGYYVKRVIENPQSTGPRTNVLSRYWDISGRYYERVFPVGFRIVLTGEELYAGENRAMGGTTRVTVAVHGVYANNEMEALIEQVWDELRKQTLEVLRENSLRVPAASGDGFPRPGTPTPERAAELRSMREKAMNELLAEHISEETYRQIDAAVARELGE